MTKRADVPAEIVAELRSVCLRLPEAYEEQAWVGTRWRIRTQTFAGPPSSAWWSALTWIGMKSPSS